MCERPAGDDVVPGFVGREPVSARSWWLVLYGDEGEKEEKGGGYSGGMLVSQNRGRRRGVFAAGL